jgi:hypothetical protein
MNDFWKEHRESMGFSSDISLDDLCKNYRRAAIEHGVFPHEYKELARLVDDPAVQRHYKEFDNMAHREIIKTVFTHKEYGEYIKKND